jgi:class 3 adenylate cyclase
LIKLDRDEEATALLDRQASIQMSGPGARASHHANLSTLAERRGDLDTARDHLLTALSISAQSGRRSAEASYHERLRDLAQKRNDFAAYIEHNTAQARIREEIYGRETTQRLALLEAERKAEMERQERERERALLYGALPKSVAERMLRGEKISGDHFEDAAILFADIVDFTRNTSDLHPGDVVTFLDELFASFDAICERHSVIKVKTIGDSYMCFKGDSSPLTNAEAVSAVAVEFLAHVSYITYPSTANTAPLRMRIGIHIGPATAGVLGTQRLQYDVWGDTVNVASRMESHGEPGRIHVSEAFADALKGEKAFEVVERGTIEIKGKGPMTTYWLEGIQA